MRSRIALFPGGGVGAGLLMLRVSVAVSTLMLTPSFTQASYNPQFIGVVGAVGLCAGLQTRVVAALTLVAPLFGLLTGPTPLDMEAVHAISAAALVMTGPGAFSADARLFGRRTVTLPDPDDTTV
jgi:hypothetical protein